ncbi:MAG: PUR family DNA/RNA-binding protein [Bacteroidales bacterium]|jgi:hypothetical protein|nr:PUR family DNA/RNA-binding protein [Bacteroidales bacterium]
MDEINSKKNEVYSTAVKAGSRTYFFDVRENRKGDLFFTICESRKVYDDFGNINYEKSKIYLYQDAFKNFINGYENVIEYIKKHKPEYFEPKNEEESFNDEINKLNQEIAENNNQDFEPVIFGEDLDNSKFTIEDSDDLDKIF